MTQPAANCPNCGAKITFHWSGSVQTVCEYCKSILVRTDLDLTKVGQVADLPSNSSPIQIRTEGVYGAHAFVATGRIIYEYDQGNWNEWHLLMNDGTSGWLSDAQDEYAITFAAPGRKLPPECTIGQEYTWDKQNYTVSTITKAHYRGVEGELPFQYRDQSEVIFVDLMSHTGNFATIDYSDDPPILYLGKVVEFATLQLKNLRSFEGWS
jgi:Domain of unknown function (DUF4178)